MKTVAFWGEGVEGKVHLEVKDISAYGCSAQASEAEDPTSQHPVLEALKSVFV